MKLLVIEDEIRLADILSDWFQKKGFEVTVCHDGLSGYEKAQNEAFHVIISDVMMPGLNGFQLVRKLREKKITTPVLFLTARVELQDKLQGFEAGAEDYLTKPFAMEELDVRVRVLLKKCGIPEEKSRENQLSFEDLILEKNTRQLRSRESNRSVKLSNKEYTLMEYFMENANQLLSKEQITVRIWGYDTEVEYNHEEVYISFLRKKMKFIGTKAAIATVRGAGYQLRSSENEEF